MKRSIVLIGIVCLILYAGFRLHHSLKSAIETRHTQIEQLAEVR